MDSLLFSVLLQYPEKKICGMIFKKLACGRPTYKIRPSPGFYEFF